MRCIGYAGEEAFDVILYISRTLTKLNYPVLIIDLSDSNALFMSVHHGMGLNSDSEIINYRNINYTRRIPSEEELAMFDTGVVFMLYGRNVTEDIQLLCSELIIVINTFPHIIDETNTLVHDIGNKDCRIRILIRDIVTLDDVERVKASVTFPFSNEMLNYLYLDYADYECAVNCQYTQLIRFTNISSGMEKYIINNIRTMLPDIKPNQIKKALLAARKGR
ncbi:MAG: hypothetical protein K0R46_2675 [Herbinix sp.]|nr:hypothetical protein [Herbinix sp.]